jgi:hypothetical protein
VIAERLRREDNRADARPYLPSAEIKPSMGCIEVRYARR